MSEQDKKKQLKEWIIKKNGKISSQDLNEETGILEKKIISSLQVMDLILYLEKINGSPVDLENIKPGAFSTINSIYNTFLKKG